MAVIKKLDKFILKSFLLLFCATFFICLFIFMMQFLWKYVDELVGKGLTFDLLAQFFYYSALTLVPSSMPLAILLASLMTFGNFGERFELIAMKAAGISLTRIMAPLIVFSVILCGVSFYFQNVVAPYASVKLWTLIVSMREKSPELDIPEGIFYDQIDKYNLYVSKKDRETGMLYGVKIYDFTNGFENAHIIVSDSGKLEMTADKKFLKLTLYNGEQFENLQNQTNLSRNVPYRRESFALKESLIEFDSSFSMVDGGFMANQSMSKNMAQLSNDIDSMVVRSDSIGRSYYNEGRDKLQLYTLQKSDSAKIAQYNVKYVNIDSIYSNASLSDKQKYLSSARQNITSTYNDWRFRTYTIDDCDKQLRRHKTEWWRKLTFSIACVIFFFIGSPLGAIIRKGGLGMPVVVSVLLFIFYYIIDNTGYKMARDGNWNIVFGMLLSSVVLASLGIFLTYKANKDSTVLSADMYKSLYRKIFLIRTKRHYFRKEVVIDVPVAEEVLVLIDKLKKASVDYLTKNKLTRPQSYFKLWLRNEHDEELICLNDTLEKTADILSNSRDLQVLNKLSDYPVLAISAHRSPFNHKWMNIAVAVILPLGLWFYFRSWIFRIRLSRDLKKIIEVSDDLSNMIINGKI